MQMNVWGSIILKIRLGSFFNACKGKTGEYFPEKHTQELVFGVDVQVKTKGVGGVPKTGSWSIFYVGVTGICDETENEVQLRQAAICQNWIEGPKSREDHSQCDTDQNGDP